ncbi:MAG: transglutaminase family protein [Thiolinea sp.]
MRKAVLCAICGQPCVHAAGQVGIPARVVVGYQGGEWNESGQYLSVHQFDAHAWTEAWLPDKGWLRN